MRDKPEGEFASYMEWDAFEKWADENGVSDHPDDWAIWWDCWKTAISAASSEG